MSIRGYSNTFLRLFELLFPFKEATIRPQADRYLTSPYDYKSPVMGLILQLQKSSLPLRGGVTRGAWTLLWTHTSVQTAYLTASKGPS